LAAVEIFIRDIVILLVAAFLGGSVARRFGYPAAIGELLVGVIIGPLALGFVEHSGSLVTFAELGAIILLFYIGLETDIAMLKRYLAPSFIAAVAGALLPLGLGYYGALLLGLAQGEALFMGTVLTATSVGITARMLSDLDRLKTKEGMTILGAGVVDDVIAIILLSVTVSVLAGEFTSFGLVSVLAKTAVFWAAVIIVGVYGLSRILDRLRIRTEALTLLLLALGFAGSYASAQLGLSSAIGAFAIGLVLSNTIRSAEIVENLQPIFLFFVPIFFVSIGMLIDPRAFVSSLVPGLLITSLAVLGKVLGCGGALLLARYTSREALTVGVGMIPRGEVGLIIAGIGFASGFIDAQAYLISVMAVSSTTIIALPILRILVAPRGQESDPSVGDNLLSESPRA
jgi:Kef-type K+ transport system membrane component KefB